MSLFMGQLYPKRALGFLALGASLHDVLTRLKAEPTRFPQLELMYSRESPVQEPVTVNLPANGIRLRFDGAQQRLRLIEVLDFTRNHITFNDRDLVRPVSVAPAAGETTGSGGPSFKHIYHKLLGPTYAGEYIPPNGDNESDVGVYVLSYPGVAFTFKLPASIYSPDKDVVSLLSAVPNQTATSMAVFDGPSWAEARATLWTAVLPSIKSNPAIPRNKDVPADEISLVRIHGGGKLQLFRKWTNSSIWIHLGETTPQELVIELGPPNAIYRKNDKRMTIHNLRNPGGGADGGEAGRTDDLTDTDQSSLMTGSEDTNDEDAVEEEAVGHVSGECFYNYFYLGFDILVSTPTHPSRCPPGYNSDGTIPERRFASTSPDRLVATKLVLHGNIPGSYEFNRHRRCCWDIAYLEDPTSKKHPPNSETKFSQIEESLNEHWKSLYPPGEGEGRQRGMVLNRGWGDSPGSSCELLGGWEDSSATAAANLPKGADGSEDSTTTLYGFPGLVFEVLRNGYVNTVTVF
ncbi:hypothetical protein jhhlp_005233 [Lomentospora prolificans]|uniref:Uncharacterized protein n=1 Tax=Lomentospora prolificans TaxID=41688 RepID=A0A2N3N772_9PEZI|nr:hypothetical protein jhhlp_005233 [Lomentospora prolificans]